MYKFKSKIDISTYPKIVFLCGSHYSKKSTDKRNLLKRIVDKEENVKSIILEEKFDFREDRQDILPYSKKFLNNLKDIELLCASIAHKIIIIHESISTGAEIALFAANSEIANKMLVLLPDRYITETNQIQGFLDLAFNKGENKLETLTYYPKIKVYPISTKQKIIYNFFSKGMLEENSFFRNKLTKFLKKENFSTIKFVKKKKKSTLKKYEKILYSFQNELDENCISIELSSLILFYQICSIVIQDNIFVKINDYIEPMEFIMIIKSELNKLYLATIQELEGKYFDGFSVKINLYENNDLNKAIIFSLYCMHALNHVEIDMKDSKYKISIKNKKLLNSISMIEKIPKRIF